VPEHLLSSGRPIEAVEADYWLLVHPDLKTVPRVRLLSAWIRAAFKESKPALQGR